MRVLRYVNGAASELLTRCKYFQAERLLRNTEGRKLASFQTDQESFQAPLCLEGCGVMYGEDVVIPFYKGDCLFVAANSVELKLHGKAEILEVRC